MAVAARPRSGAAASAALAAGMASAVVAGGGAFRAAASATVPMLLFLTVALSLASLGERAGLAQGAAERGLKLRWIRSCQHPSERRSVFQGLRGYQLDDALCAGAAVLGTQLLGQRLLELAALR
jgi:hypothetical protein